LDLVLGVADWKSRFGLCRLPISLGCLGNFDSPKGSVIFALIHY